MSVIALVFAQIGGAATVRGPRLTFFELQFPKRKGPGSESASSRLTSPLVSVDANGHDRRLPFAIRGFSLYPFSPPSWSVDGREVAFIGARIETVEGKPSTPEAGVFLADADGKHLRLVPHTARASSVVLAPDGLSVAFSVVKAPYQHSHPINPRHRPKPPRPKEILEELTEGSKEFEGSTAWVAPTAGGRPRRLTPWVDGQYAQPTSFSSDGSLLAVTLTPAGGEEEVDTVELSTGTLRTLEPEAGEAAFSPDGSRIAFTSFRDGESVSGFDEPEATSELYVADADGSRAHRLTHTPSREEVAPSWNPSGDRIAYLSEVGGLLNFLGTGARVMDVNSDGSCPTVVAVPHPEPHGGGAGLQRPTWILGPGRDAGPISC